MEILLSYFSIARKHLSGLSDAIMPFKSKAQARYLFAREPEVAKKFAKETPSMKGIPEKKTAEIKKKK